MTETDFPRFRIRLERIEEAYRQLEIERDQVMGDLTEALAVWARAAIRDWAPAPGETAVNVSLRGSEPHVRQVTATTSLRPGVLRFRLSENATLTYEPGRRTSDDEFPECVLPPDVWERLERLWHAAPASSADKSD